MLTKFKRRHVDFFDRTYWAMAVEGPNNIGTPRKGVEMKPLSIRTIDQLVEEQINKAAIRSRSRTRIEQRHATLPVIAISREPCAGGTTLGRAVAERLGFACWDQELLTRIAEKSGAVESILASVDERVHSPVMEFVRSLLVGFEYTQDEYRIVLTKVVGAIAHQGAAVVVGRGAHLILGPTRALRVRVVCATEERIARLVQRDGVSPAVAARRIKELGADIDKFMRHHYQQDAGDPHNFDIVVNSGSLPVQSATEVVVAAYKARFGRVMELQSERSLRLDDAGSSRVDLKSA